MELIGLNRRMLHLCGAGETERAGGYFIYMELERYIGRMIHLHETDDTEQEDISR